MSTAVLTGSGNGDALTVAYNPGSQEYTFSGGVNTPAPVAAAGFTGVAVLGNGGASTLTVTSTAPGQPLTLLNDAGADGTALSVVVAPGASLVLDTTQHLSALTIGQGASVRVLPGGFDTLVTGSLQVAGATTAWTGSLDLTNNGLVVHNGDLLTVTNQIASGLNAAHAGYWNGQGISSSTAASDPHYLTALGVAPNNTVTGSALYTAFAGQAVTTADVLVKDTDYGDANLDGVVNAADYARTDAGFLGKLAGWANGDFNYDGSVDGSDYTLIDNAFNTQAPLPLVPLNVVSPNTAEIDLSWTPSSDPSVTGYDVYRSNTASLDVINATQVASESTDTTLDDAWGLSGAGTYYYSVLAEHADGSTSPVAISVPATTLASDVGAPVQPTDLVVGDTNTTDENLSWIDAGTNVAGFKVEYAHAGQNDWATAEVAPPNSDAATVFDLDFDTNYDFRVTALNSNSGTANAAAVSAAPAATPATTQGQTQPLQGLPFVLLVGGNLQHQYELDGSNGKAPIGVGQLAQLFDKTKYDVHVYGSYFQEGIHDNGTGPAYDDLSKVLNGGERNWSLIAYSHGCGSSYELTKQIHNEFKRAPVKPVFSYACYIQAVKHRNFADFFPEKSLPVDAIFVDNFYEDTDLKIIGISGFSLGAQELQGSNVLNHHIMVNDDGKTLTDHTHIDKQVKMVQMPIYRDAIGQIALHPV